MKLSNSRGQERKKSHIKEKRKKLTRMSTRKVDINTQQKSQLLKH
ncbi:unnamed protein product [Paramecium primaurelia]|uniref:Uncharacterized protein n=1 Tax=Paramecium primaurelia TaxID=5886 RepID=A0A8S1JW46_PARPR|nr:unnamed protein product [Paramecium primaurelia]